MDGVHWVHQRLGRQRGDAAFDAGTDGADGEKAGRDGDSQSAGGGVTREDGPGHNARIAQGVMVARGDAFRQDVGVNIGTWIMNDALFDASAGRKTLTVSINGDLLDKVHAAGVDLTHVIEKALERALLNADPEAVRNGIAEELQWLDDYVARHGDPRAEWLEMSDEDDAA